MIKILKKISLLLIAISVAILIFYIPSRKKEKAHEKVITIWETYNDEEHAVFLEIVDEFQKIHPEIKIKVQRIPWTGHERKLQVAMITHTAPDIARIDTAFTPRLVKTNSVVDLTDYGGLEIAKDLIPAAVNSNIFPKCFYIPGSTSTEKRIFGLPDQTTGVVLFYNKKMFRKAGIEKPPKNWDEFVKVAKKLTVDTDSPPDGKPNLYGFAQLCSLWWNFPFFNTFGAKFLDETGKKCLLDSEETEKALTFIVDLYQTHKVEAGAWRVGAIIPEIGFLNNLYAMIFMGPWNLKRFKSANIEFGVSLIPEGPCGTSTNVGGTNMVILKETKYPKECFEFLKFLTTKEIQAKWANSLGQIPVNMKAFDMVKTDELPELKVFMEQMKTAIARPPVLDYAWLENIINSEMYAALAGEKSPKQALKDATQKINEEILSME